MAQPRSVRAPSPTGGPVTAGGSSTPGLTAGATPADPNKSWGGLMAGLGQALPYGLNRVVRINRRLRQKRG